MARKTYKKKTKNGNEYYFYRYFNKHGKAKDLYAKTVSEMEEKIKKTEAIEDGLISDDRQLFLDFIDAYLTNVHFVNKKASTKEAYMGVFNKYIKESNLGRIQLKNLESIDVQKFYNTLFKQGTTESTLKRIHKIIRPSIKHAYVTSKITKDFTGQIIIPKDTNKKKFEIYPLELREQQIFEEASRESPIYELVIMSLYTGMRQGELLALNWEDINFEKSFVSVSKSYKYSKDIESNKFRGEINNPKTEASNRTIPMPENLKTFLEEYKKRRSEYFQNIGIKMKDNFLVFSTPVGTFLDASNIRKELIKIYDSCGLKYRRFHDLRHTFATRLFEMKTPPKTVQVLLGHSDISITLNIYTHVLEETKTEEMAKLNNIFSKL